MIRKFNAVNLPIVALLLLTMLVGCDSGSSTSQPANSPSDNGASGDGGTFTVSNTGDAPACAVTPRGRDLNIMASSSDSSEVVGALPSGSWVQVSLKSNSEWYQIHDPDSPVNDAWVIGRGVTLQQPCACGPDCVQYDIPADAPQITDCEVGFIAGDFVTIYFLPDAGSDVFAVSTAGDDAAGVAQAVTDDSWIGYDPGVQTTDEGAARLRWLQADDSSVSLNGTQCVDLPTYSFTRVEG